MTPEESAAQILVEGVARIAQWRLIFATSLFMCVVGGVFALVYRWLSARERIDFYKARDTEARELVEHSIDTINRMAADRVRAQNLLADLDDYFRNHRAPFDDREREPLHARVIEHLAERRPPLQITFNRAPERKARKMEAAE